VRPITTFLRAEGRVARHDYELFMLCEPKRGWRHACITDQRTMPDFARQMKWLVDCAFPEAARVVMDNLNTHKAASLYETVAPEKARRNPAQTGVSLYAEACQLVAHGGNRVERL
jgi:hypothetical protein